MFSPDLAVSLLTILALTNIREEVWASTMGPLKALVRDVLIHLAQGCTDAPCWVHTARCIITQPGSSHAWLHSLRPRNFFSTKVFWYILLIKSSNGDIGYTGVRDTTILQYLHVFGTSVLKAKALIAFFSVTNMVSLLERSPQCKY